MGPLRLAVVYLYDCQGGSLLLPPGRSPDEKRAVLEYGVYDLGRPVFRPEEQIKMFRGYGIAEENMPVPLDADAIIEMGYGIRHVIYVNYRFEGQFVIHGCLTCKYSVTVAVLIVCLMHPCRACCVCAVRSVRVQPDTQRTG